MTVAFPRDFLDGSELNLSSLPLMLLFWDRARSRRSACANTNWASLRRASGDSFCASLRTLELDGKVRGSERDPLVEEYRYLFTIVSVRLLFQVLSISRCLGQSFHY